MDLYEEDQGNGGHRVSKVSLAADWYAPAEIIALRIHLPVAAAVNVLVIAGEGIRGDTQAAKMTALGLLCLLFARILLPDGRHTWKTIGSRVLAGGALLLGVVSLLMTDFSLYDIWSRAWLIIPSALALFWLSRASVSAWASGKKNQQLYDEGFIRNRELMPRLESFGVHTVLIHAVLLVIIPVAWILDVAVSPGNILGGTIGDAFTLEHFINVIGQRTFWIWSRNSLVVACGTSLVGLLLAIPAAYAFSRYEFSGRRTSMFLFMLVQMFPGIIILVPYFMVMKTLGLLNTSAGLIVVYSVTALPLGVWLLKGYFDTVPRALEEAAVLDGCSQFEVFIRIVLPLSVPAVAITALFLFLAAWNEFLLALVFNTSNDLYTLPVGLASMIPESGQQWGDFAAASVVVSIPVVILFVLVQKALIQGLSAGSVKG